jgi:hypothetical protein
VGAYKEGPDLFHTVFCPDIKSLIYASIAWSVFFLKMDIQPDIQALNNSDQMELNPDIATTVDNCKGIQNEYKSTRWDMHTVFDSNLLLHLPSLVFCCCISHILDCLGH